MTTKYAVLLMSLVAVGPLSVFAQSVTYSGTNLNNVTDPNILYSGNTGDAQYVAGTPDVAQLYTADLSVNGDSPAVFVALSPGITLESLTASYVLAAGSTVDPYWILYMTDDSSFTLPVVSTDGGPLDSSALVHVGDLTDGSITLSALDSVLDPNSPGGTVPYGGETVAYIGLEIGDGGSGAGTANIESITIGSSVPDGASTLLLLGFGLAGLGALSFKRNRQQITA